MKLCLLLTVTSLISLSCAWPASQEEPKQKQALVSQSQDSKTSLHDVVDEGSQHDEGGARKERFLGGYWVRPWDGYYSFYYPRYYHSYYNYWW